MQEESKQAPELALQTPPVLQSPAAEREEERIEVSGDPGQHSSNELVEQTAEAEQPIEVPRESQADMGRDASPDPGSQLMQRNQVPDYESDNSGNGAPDDRREDIFEQNPHHEEEQKQGAAERNADGAHTPISSLAQMRPSQVVIEAPTKDEIEMTS